MGYKIDFKLPDAKIKVCERPRLQSRLILGADVFAGTALTIGEDGLVYPAGISDSRIATALEHGLRGDLIDAQGPFGSAQDLGE